MSLTARRIDTKTAKLEGSALASHIAHSTAVTANGLLVLAVRYHAHEAQHHALEARYLVLEVQHHAPEVRFRAEREGVPHRVAVTVMYPVAPRLDGGPAA